MEDQWDVRNALRTYGVPLLFFAACFVMIGIVACDLWNVYDDNSTFRQLLATALLPWAPVVFIRWKTEGQWAFDTGGWGYLIYVLCALPGYWMGSLLYYGNPSIARMLMLSGTPAVLTLLHWGREQRCSIEYEILQGIALGVLIYFSFSNFIPKLF